MKHTIEKHIDGEHKFVECETLIHALRSQSIMDIEAKDGKFQLTEACDNYFSIWLTHDQLRILGQELIDLANSTK